MPGVLTRQYLYNCYGYDMPENTTKKQICMVAYTTYEFDTRVRREAETLASLDEYEVLFIVPKGGKTPRNFVLDGVNITELNLSKYQGNNKLRYIISYLNFTISAFIKCTKLLFTRNIDIFHFHNMPDFLVFAGIIPRLFGKKIILDIHDTMPETYVTKFRKGDILFKLFCLEEVSSCRFAHKIICVNHIQRDILVKRGIPSQKILVSMNVPDPKLFKNREATGVKAKRNNGNFRLVYHGTLAERLGINLALQAISKLNDKIPGLEFHIFGRISSGYGLKLVGLSRVLGTDPYVHFNKTVPMESLLGVLEGMHLGVISNRKNIATELMLPVKMIEYITLSIPVIAPRLKTIQYYFSEEMVRYFEPEDVDSLAEAILDLYHNESKRTNQAKAAKGFIEKYGWEKQQMGLINLYKELE